MLFHAALVVIICEWLCARNGCVPVRTIQNLGLPAVAAMSIPKILSVCMVVVSLGAAAGSPVMAQRIANGDFEAVTAGAFDSWTSSPDSGVAIASAAPTVVDGNHSATLAAGGGLLWQTVSSDGIRHFAMEFDLAVLDTASTDVRSFGVVTYSTAGGSHSGADNIDSIRVYATAVLAQRISPPVRDGGVHRPRERYNQSFAWHSSAGRRAVLWQIRTRNSCTDCRRAGLSRVPQQERATRHAVA